MVFDAMQPVGTIDTSSLVRCIVKIKSKDRDSQKFHGETAEPSEKVRSRPALSFSAAPISAPPSSYSCQREAQSNAARRPAAAAAISTALMKTQLPPKIATALAQPQQSAARRR